MHTSSPPPAARVRIAGEVAGAALAMRRPEGVKQKLDGNTAEKLKRGELTPRARIDLHGMTEWMPSPHGVLKQMVPRWLNEKAFAALISGSGPAHRRHGGDGALYVYLRKRL